mmetsp:Transcript_41370/g.82911  ORF Transcript_41370/g.82911 Transcript_41370/m.82911 type:complete len:81 (+) Transcript_41370:39-281(+)
MLSIDRCEGAANHRTAIGRSSACGFDAATFDTNTCSGARTTKHPVTSEVGVASFTRASRGRHPLADLVIAWRCRLAMLDR